MAFEDKTLTCRDCAEEFIFTAGEQGFYFEKGLMNEPQRCPACRASRRRERTTGSRQMYEVVCAQCGKDTTVPFLPKLDRPVYCGTCYEQVRSSAGSL